MIFFLIRRSFAMLCDSFSKLKRLILKVTGETITENIIKDYESNLFSADNWMRGKGLLVDNENIKVTNIPRSARSG